MTSKDDLLLGTFNDCGKVDVVSFLELLSSLSYRQLLVFKGAVGKLTIFVN
jgi:hypothetical protein